MMTALEAMHGLSNIDFPLIWFDLGMATGECLIYWQRRTLSPQDDAILQIIRWLLGKDWTTSIL